jgi:hypothetical protein
VEHIVEALPIRDSIDGSGDDRWLHTASVQHTYIWLDTRLSSQLRSSGRRLPAHAHFYL